MTEKGAQAGTGRPMVRQMTLEFDGKKNIIILGDSWYVKKDLVSIVDEYENLDLTGNTRMVSSSMTCLLHLQEKRDDPKSMVDSCFSVLFSHTIWIFFVPDRKRSR